MDNKIFKSVYIHNGCRNPKVKPFKKLSFCQSIEKSIVKKTQSLIDLNMSLRDAETLKASYYGKEYLKTLEHASFNLTITLNDVRIQINVSILQAFIKLTKKLNVYECRKL